MAFFSICIQTVHGISPKSSSLTGIAIQGSISWTHLSQESCTSSTFASYHHQLPPENSINYPISLWHFNCTFPQYKPLSDELECYYPHEYVSTWNKMNHLSPKTYNKYSHILIEIQDIILDYENLQWAYDHHEWTLLNVDSFIMHCFFLGMSYLLQ